MSKQDLLNAVESETAMAMYLEVRDDAEIISDIRSLITPGLTKRDYFAAAALPVICANSYTEEQVAKAAFDLADALIAASKSGGSND